MAPVPESFYSDKKFSREGKGSRGMLWDRKQHKVIHVG